MGQFVPQVRGTAHPYRMAAFSQREIAKGSVERQLRPRPPKQKRGVEVPPASARASSAVWATYRTPPSGPRERRHRPSDSLRQEPGDAFYGYNAEPGRTEEFWILDVDGTRLMIEANSSPASPRKDVAEMRAILDSIRIQR